MYIIVHPQMRTSWQINQYGQYGLCQCDFPHSRFVIHFLPRELSRIPSSMWAEELLLVVHHPAVQQGQKPSVPFDCLMDRFYTAVILPQ